MREFLAMGGYGAFVWAAYGATLLVLVGLFWQSWHAARKRTAEAERARAERRAQARGPVQAIVAERRPSAGPSES
ncbi:MAG: heme exporter protein CcmD [Geminicoccaceae bacterium]|nr:heme exporter protein CcmD [Geminicoccaceae bacterium]MCX8101355.1 heme exporter protein CcmD [Geminicoccaceae bacterium]MDW8369436.1 heme exporter protein CcmD [Geminicoccaceae bacterium]